MKAGKHDSAGYYPVSHFEGHGNVKLALPQIKEVISKSPTPAKPLPKAK